MTPTTNGHTTALNLPEDATYRAALELVARIDEDLTRGVRHYRTKAGALLTTLDETVRAIVGDDLEIKAKGHMDIETIKQIQAMYRELKAQPGGGSHKRIKQAFGLTNAQEYAINIFGRDNQLSAALLAEKMDSIREGMTIGEIAVTLGFPAETEINSR